jgi:hypothetical protein
MTAKFWMGHVDRNDDFGDMIAKEFIDGKTTLGPWGIMTPKNWRRHGIGRLGLGCGQRYEKQTDGRWMKVEG